MLGWGIIGGLFISGLKDLGKAGAAAVSCVLSLIELSEENENEERKEDVADKINTSLDRIGRKYGEPDRLILSNDQMEYGYFALFIEQKMLCINDTEIKFSDIASYKMVDNYIIKNGDISGDIETRTDEDSLLGRAVGGSLLGGDTGAMIGAITASKSSSVHISQKNGKLVHDYTLLINLKGLNREGVEMHIGDDWRLAAELEHLFDQIIKESNSSMS